MSQDDIAALLASMQGEPDIAEEPLVAETASEDVTAQIDAHFQLNEPASADGVEVASEETSLED